MEPIEIINSTPSKIVIRSGTRTATIFGEALTKTLGQPDFVIYAGSLKAWHGPAGIEDIPRDERNFIVAEVVSQLRGRGWNIEVEE
jgi:hypothetical protein